MVYKAYPTTLLSSLKELILNLMCLFLFGRCSILVVSHGDPLQILQTLLNAAMQVTGSDCNDLSSRIQAVRDRRILSQHRKNALLTGELRSVVQ